MEWLLIPVALIAMLTIFVVLRDRARYTADPAEHGVEMPDGTLRHLDTREVVVAPSQRPTPLGHRRDIA